MDTTKTIEENVRNFSDPFSKKKWQTAIINRVESNIEVTVPFPVKKNITELTETLLNHLKHTTDSEKHKLELSIKSKIKKHAVANKSDCIPNIKNIIAVTSTKGGVGKSTIASQIAIALQQAGAHVGLLDADIYGPNIPNLMGTHQRAQITEKTYKPIQQHGISIMSMGYLVDEGTPLMWRGPMATAYLQQMLFKTEWPKLDYLIVDLPPGTGDIQLTIAQKIPLTAAVLVTTPQCLSIKDLEKGLGLLQKTQTPVLGVVENMSHFSCPNCKKTSRIFSATNTQAFIKKHQIPLLGNLPLDPLIVDACENQSPVVIRHPNCNASQAIHNIAYLVTTQLAELPVHIPNLFPKIVVERME